MLLRSSIVMGKVINFFIPYYVSDDWNEINFI